MVENQYSGFFDEQKETEQKGKEKQEGTVIEYNYCFITPWKALAIRIMLYREF